MRFSKNRLYIESYTKCPNCGILIYEDSTQSMEGTELIDGKLYCSSWCVNWQRDRAARSQAQSAAQSIHEPGSH
jgi:hypothetical protein